MDSSQICGGSEDCQGSESGWTMYIASSKNYNHNEDSDDSLASDASSGPSYQGTSRAGVEDEDEEEQNNGLNKKKVSLKKPILEEKKKNKKEDKKEVGFGHSTRADDTTTTTTSQTGSKVRNKFWKGRTK